MRVINVRSRAPCFSFSFSDAIAISSLHWAPPLLSHSRNILNYTHTHVYTHMLCSSAHWLTHPSCIAMAILSSLALLPVSLSIHSKPLLRNSNRTRAQFQNVQCLSPGEDLPLNYESWMPKRDAKSRRRAGVLLHPTSFPGPFGIGDLGPQAFQFLDWLHDAGCSVWQVHRLHWSLVFNMIFVNKLWMMVIS